MYDGLVALLRKKYDKAPMVMEAADAIEELSKQNEKWEEVVKTALDFIPCWIPVTERLPEMHEQVLVCNEDYGETALGFSEVAVWDGSDWICTWDMESRLHYITHWMPLPEPPKEET